MIAMFPSGLVVLDKANQNDPNVAANDDQSNNLPLSWSNIPM